MGIFQNSYTCATCGFDYEAEGEEDELADCPRCPTIDNSPYESIYVDDPDEEAEEIAALEEEGLL